MTRTGLRAAVVGAGLMGRWHSAYARRAGVSIAGVVDPNAAAAEALCRRYSGARPFASLETCLAQAAVDVVHVCTPVASHATLARVALDAGKHVLVEKPLAESASDVRHLAARAAALGSTLCVVHQMPFQRGFARLRDRPAALGDLVRLEYRARTAGGDGLDPAERRGLLLAILAHPVSLFRALLGQAVGPLLEPQSFTSDGLELAGRRDDTRLVVSVSLRGRPTQNELELVGARGSAVVDLYHGYALVDRSGVSRADKALAPFRRGGRQLAAAAVNLARRALEREPAYPGLRSLIARFYDAVDAGGAGPVSVDEAVDCAELMERLATQQRA